MLRSFTSQTLFRSAQSLRYLSIYLPPVLFFSMRTQKAVQPVCCDSMLFQEHHSAHWMCIAPRCIEPFVLQYFSAMKYNNSFPCSVLSIICCCLITVLYILKKLRSRNPLFGCIPSTFDPPVEKHCNRLCLTHRRVTNV